MAKKTWSIVGGVLAAVGVVSLGMYFFASPTTAMGEGTTITYEYATKVLDGMPEKVDSEISKDGKTYVLPANWENDTKISLNDSVHHYSMVKEFSDLTSQQAPETQDTELGGKTVTLTLESADYVPETKNYSAKGNIEYTIAKDEIPEKADITYENEDGNKVTVPGTLVDITAKNGSKGVSSQLYSQISMWPDVNAYMVGETVVGYDPYTPEFDGYEKIVADAAGLSAGSKVVGGVWDGDTYVENGMVKRNVIWYVQKPGSESVWVGHYVAEGTMTTYDAKAVYGAAVDDLGLPSELATDVMYHYTAEVPYVAESAQNTSLIFGFPRQDFLYVGIAGLVLALLCLIFSVLLGHKGKEHCAADVAAENTETAECAAMDSNHSDILLDLDAPDAKENDSDVESIVRDIEDHIL